MGKQRKAYISGSLTGVDNSTLLKLKRFYEDIADLCREFDINPYVPHLKSDPITHPDLSPSEVYEMDRKEVLGSDIVIAYVGIPSFGVGIEIEIARENNIPVILIYMRKTKGCLAWQGGFQQSELR